MEIVKNFQFQLIKYWILYLTVGIIFVLSTTSGICAAEDEELEISVLDKIEQGLIHQSLRENSQTTEGKNLIKLEDKKKESISSKITLSQESTDFSYKKAATIVVLNKITSKSELVKFELNKAKSFGYLSIEVSQCAKSINPLRPTNLMLIKVFDHKIDYNKSLVFNGWMDSLNLAICVLEHPVYEIIPRDCLD